MDMTAQDREYIALIRKEAGTAYGIDIPDLPGCISAGDSREEALELFEQALSLHLQGMREDGIALPGARPLREVAAQEQGDYIEAFIIEISRDSSGTAA